MDGRSESCVIDGCRFSLGYAADVTLGPLRRAPTVPTVFVFATDEIAGFQHFCKHFVALNGHAVVDLLRMAWTTARITVVRGREGSLVWVIDHDVFRRFLAADRISIVTKTCTSYGAGQHCCSGCEHADRPDEETLRSVRPWSPVAVDRPIVHTDVRPEDLPEYLSGQPERWIGLRVQIRDSPPFSNPWPQEFHYCVPVIVEGAPGVARVVASKRQSELIDEDEARFARGNDVIFTARHRSGRLGAIFVRREWTAG